MIRLGILLSNLLDVKDIADSGDQGLMEAYLRLHDTGYDPIKEAKSLTVEELFDVAKLTELIADEIQDNPNLYTDYALGYVSVSGGLREQFDILRFGKGHVTNIELKHTMPNGGLKTVERQLRRHRLYLSVLAGYTVDVCCFVNGQTPAIYCLNADNSIEQTSLQTVLTMLEKTQEGPHQVQPIDLSDMIVSPYVNPEAFAKHKYFLTEEQYHTRDSIVNSDKERIVMTGGAGTGKTLVLMDAARTFINQKKMPKESVLVIFCAPMDNYEMISNDLGINVRPIASLSIDDIRKLKQDVIFVDEAQRIYQEKMDALLSLSGRKEIFSIDKKQTLHKKENDLSFHVDYENAPEFLYLPLTDKIRYDPSLNSFIRRLLENKSSNVHPYYYEKVRLHYTPSREKAKDYIHKKIDEGYTSIEPTQYVTKKTKQTKRRKISLESIDVHQAIGREYDKVLVVIDNYYSHADGGIFGKYNKYYPYIQVAELFEALTRVRKELLIVVVDNPDMYAYVQQILTWKDDKERTMYETTVKSDKSLQALGKALEKNPDLELQLQNMTSQIAELSKKTNSETAIVLRKIKAILKKRGKNGSKQTLQS